MSKDIGNASGCGWVEKYGENIIALMPRDPKALFAYWEVTGDSDEKVRAGIADNGSFPLKRVLRLYKHTKKGKEQAFDIDVGEEADNWYIHIDEDRMRWSADVGLLDRSGKFHVQASSGIIEGPEGSLSDEVDQKWQGKGPKRSGDAASLGISSLIAREK